MIYIYIYCCTKRVFIALYTLYGEVNGPRVQTLVSYLYNPWGRRSFSTKTGQKPLFSCNFVLKTDVWAYIPPGISINICGNETLKA